MSKNNPTASYYPSRKTIIASNGNTYHVSRDDDGDYKIEAGANTIYVGPANVAYAVANALEELVEDNGEN